MDISSYKRQLIFDCVANFEYTMYNKKSAKKKSKRARMQVQSVPGVLFFLKSMKCFESTGRGSI